MLWIGVIGASLAVFSWKILGYLVPQKLVSSNRALHVSSKLTIALLAALVGVQTFVSSGHVVFDARVPAVIVAGVLSWLRVPFVVMVIISGGVAALARYYLHW